MRPLEHRQLHCIYAEDMRQEVNGKATIVGCWQPGTFVHMPPTGALLLPRLCVSVIFYTPLDRPYAQVKMTLQVGDQVLGEFDLDQRSLNGATAHVPLLPGEIRWAQQLGLNLELSNVPIMEPGILHINALADGEELCSNGLYFRREAISSM